MAVNFWPNLSDPVVLKHLPKFDFTYEDTLCTSGPNGLFWDYVCVDCPFGTSPGLCKLNYDYNPHLRLFVEQCKLAHPELFI